MSIDPALLALALRYRTTAERSFYKALSELQRLRTVIRNEAIRRQKAEDREYQNDLTAALDYLCYAPIGAPPPPQFVSQNRSAVPNVPPDRP